MKRERLQMREHANYAARGFLLASIDHLHDSALKSADPEYVSDTREAVKLLFHHLYMLRESARRRDRRLSEN